MLDIFPTDKPIFILTSGQRCGSTLLQRLLNSNKDILIWGEQHGYLNGFLREYRDLLDYESEYSNHRKTFLQNGYDNFIPNMLPEDVDLKRAAITHIIALFGDPALKLGRTIWGFKEVRYDAQIALFLYRCFPNARFIHLTRNIIDCFISLKHWEESPGTWNRSWTEIFIEDWKRINSSFLNVTDRIPQLMRIRYEDMISNPKGTIDRLSSFLSITTESLDSKVFKRKLHVESSDGIKDLRSEISPADLNAEERNLLSTNIIIDISKEYGYKIEF
ncbi:MAG: sulfotransferase [Bacteroidota bacterium]